ncbi:hypothetical protein SRHO_G00284010 [Serrasalmus rhombeus]
MSHVIPLATSSILKGRKTRKSKSEMVRLSRRMSMGTGFRHNLAGECVEGQEVGGEACDEAAAFGEPVLTLLLFNGDSGPSASNFHAFAVYSHGSDNGKINKTQPGPQPNSLHTISVETSLLDGLTSERRG